MILTARTRFVALWMHPRTSPYVPELHFLLTFAKQISNVVNRENASVGFDLTDGASSNSWVVPTFDICHLGWLGFYAHGRARIAHLLVLFIWLWGPLSQPNSSEAPNPNFLSTVSSSHLPVTPTELRLLARHFQDLASRSDNPTINR